MAAAMFASAIHSVSNIASLLYWDNLAQAEIDDDCFGREKDKPMKKSDNGTSKNTTVNRRDLMKMGASAGVLGMTQMLNLPEAAAQAAKNEKVSFSPMSRGVE